ncbi:hypothetical protein A6E15_07590 [Natrinema saccharevitans]|uniref:Nucleotide-diphospho-sugar transferase domain-containing protein n=1 Tax=Natrinema saccharevitans TaxID=301967 RepID=A0A1S8AVT0_9EURY|nr:hypothetical protein [Natrinema saccharevitans]OLZ40860.1 hypothetical protein A6E15_07590 [Natrinema saccharevitans]
MDRGITYIAFGDVYRQLAVQSAERISELGDWPICLITNSKTHIRDELFKHIKIVQPESVWRKHRYGGGIKPEFFGESPFERTLYLDTDTYVVDGDAIDDLFALLDEYELAAAHDTVRKLEHEYGTVPDTLETSPDAFPWLNTGVVAYRKSDSVLDLFHKWRWIYHVQSTRIEGINDQAAFCEALYYNDVIHTVLPPEYNHRISHEQTLTGEVKILHGPADDYPAIADYINEYVRNRAENVESILPYQSISYYVFWNEGHVRSIPVRLTYPIRTELEYGLRRARQLATQTKNKAASGIETVLSR